MDMKIFVVNLKKYNNCEETGAWFDLPVEWEDIVQEIFNEDELDEFGNPMYDHAIHDYELPFACGEYTNISFLNDVVENIQTVDSDLLERILEETYSLGDVISFADEMGFDDMIQNIVPLEVLLSSLQTDIEEGNIYSVKCKLEDVKYNISDVDYFVLEGDGNFRTLTDVDLEDIVSDVFAQQLISSKPVYKLAS